MGKILKSSNSDGGWEAIKRIQIMIVDDSTPMRTMLKKMIELYPEFEVVQEASNAGEARQLVRKSAPDVITLDLKMGGLDSMKFLEEIVNTTQTPIIVISVLDFESLDSGPIYKALRLGAFDYLKKPSFDDFFTMADVLHEKILSANAAKKKIKRQIFLSSGEIAFGKLPTRITTILGSCISVCLYDSKLKAGAMCHYALPDVKETKKPPEGKDNLYGKYAISNTLAKMEALGSKANTLEAKVIGGANVVSSLKSFKVHEENIKLADTMLKKLKIRVVDRATGGKEGRKVIFCTDTGSVEVTRVSEEKAENTKIALTSPFSDIEALSKDLKSKTRPREAIQREKGQQVDKNTNAKESRWSERKKSAANKKIQVLIVDDSKPMRQMIKKMVNTYSDMEVMAEAESAKEAEKIIRKEKPDVITLDIRMPETDGVGFLKKLMPTNPIPTIVVTILDFAEAGPVFETLELGAFDYIQKPSMEKIFSVSNELHQKIQLAYSSNYLEKKSSERKKLMGIKKEVINSKKDVLKQELLVIGASTGGPVALREILMKLPKNIPPILLIQHIPEAFSQTFAQRLNRVCDFNVKVANDGDTLNPGEALVARGDKHIKVELNGKGEMVVKLTEDDPVNNFRPSIDVSFNSIPLSMRKKVLAVLLSGIGVDGAQGLLKLKQSGATTIVQDEATSVVFDMRSGSMRNNAAKDIVALHDIPKYIAEYYNSK